MQESYEEIWLNSSGEVTAVFNIEAAVKKVSNNGYFSFILDIPSDLRVWASDDLDRSLIEKISVGNRIIYSAELDDDDDMVMTDVKMIN